MEYTKKSLSQLWLLLKNKQKELGIDKVYRKNLFSRASFFRYIKKLKDNRYILIHSCKQDSRKTLVSVSSLLDNSNY